MNLSLSYSLSLSVQEGKQHRIPTVEANLQNNLYTVTLTVTLRHQTTGPGVADELDSGLNPTLPG